MFTPFGDHAQYAICSPIADENGTVYFKNDAGFLYAVGHMVESLTVEHNPEKTEYTAGELFDNKGLSVSATFFGGRTADVTDYLEYSKNPLVESQTEFALRFPYVRYHDGENGVGTEIPAPMVFVTLQIKPGTTEPVFGDLDGDGQTTLLDGDLLYAAFRGEIVLTAGQMAKADVNADGKINTLDVAWIYAVANGKMEVPHFE